jgi:hypothetical protein
LLVGQQQAAKAQLTSNARAAPWVASTSAGHRSA